MGRLLLVFLFVTSAALAQEKPTAYEALRVVGMQFNRAAVRRVISVTGVDGDPQPVRWKILIADRNAPGGLREFEVANGQIVSNRTPTGNVVGTAEGATIDTAKLNLDSSGAFTVASHTADQSHVNFSFVSYTLRTNDRGTPAWIVTLENEARAPLGTIHITANRGNVTRVEGLYHGRNMEQIEEDHVVDGAQRDEADPEIDVTKNGDDEGDENVVKAEIKRMFHRTKHDADRMFGRVQRSFDRFFNRD